MSVPIRQGSVCSGIEAASVAFGPLGWEAAWFAEVDKAASELLAHHYPDVENLGDMTKLAGMVAAGLIEAPDVLCGGTPCQTFSLAGRRAGLDDARGQLTLSFVDLADAIDEQRADAGAEPAVIVWENVPGVLSHKDNPFGCFLAALAGEDLPLVPSGKRWTNAGVVLGPQRAIAWRVLDAQYFGLAQRRRRVIVVASARQGFDPAAVLLEFEGVRRDSAPRREAREDVTHAVAPCLTGSGRGVERTGDPRGQDPVVACQRGGPDRVEVIPGDLVVRSVALRGREGGATAELGGDHAYALRASDGGGSDPYVLAPAVAAHAEMAVRRLMPVECERLQGFPDNYTLIPNAKGFTADSRRYKQIGNSWATPMFHWVGRRIAAELERCAQPEADNDNTVRLLLAVVG